MDEKEHVRIQQATYAVTPKRVKDMIRGLRRECGRLRLERNRARAELEEMTARYEALAPALAEAVTKLEENGL